ncbi:hypothetical protein DSM112329_03915 [Paraconexibacter sp. AEG42_29]|uniref:Uncharacterized protein n=1 Tax=Paraconexibacter sp. AEG42_29 TaxID=2997339 RepID=A0AAU7AZY2_9ACTN
MDPVAIGLGAAVCVLVAVLASQLDPPGRSSDPSMVWEAGVAVGFGAVVVAGPFWLAQGVLTLLAMLDDGGAPAWGLWLWWFVAPVVGWSPGASVVRGVRRARPAREPDLHAVAAAVQQAAIAAWADLAAPPGWELRRTPPLPASWPPAPGGAAVWLCYAERDDTPAAIEVAAPWARITLPADAVVPTVERLEAGVHPLGLQGIRPLAPEDVARPLPGGGALLGALRAGDPDGRLAAALVEWRGRSGLVARHPAVAPHLPPG